MRDLGFRTDNRAPGISHVQTGGEALTGGLPSRCMYHCQYIQFRHHWETKKNIIIINHPTIAGCRRTSFGLRGGKKGGDENVRVRQAMADRPAVNTVKEPLDTGNIQSRSQTRHDRIRPPWKHVNGTCVPCFRRKTDTNKGRVRVTGARPRRMPIVSTNQG